MRSATIRSKLELALAERNPAPFNPPQISRPETVSTGLAGIDRLTGGIPRGRITEIFGPASSGRTSLLLSLFSQITHNGKPPPLAVRLEEVRPSRRAVLVDGLHQRTTTCELKETVIGE